MKSEVTQFLRQIGKKGGKKTAKRGKEFFAEIGRQGAKKRWAKRRRAGDN